MENQKRKSRVQKRDKSKALFITTSNILLLCIIFVLTYMTYGMYKETKVRTLEEGGEEKIVLNEEKEENLKGRVGKHENIKVITMPDIAVSKEYEGYEVECRLEIPKIELNTNVLKNYSSHGLEICASKYYGPNANEVGNYCIAGHNYNKENMFNHLIDLSVGDSIFVTDNENGIVEYTIYDMYKVKPQNVEPLSQDTNGKREVTLITCVNYSRSRLVVKAIERNNYE